MATSRFARLDEPAKPGTATPAKGNVIGAKVEALNAKGEFDTKLTPSEEAEFKVWKQKYAPKDSGMDYDLRGAFKAGEKPGADGHWTDKFKKPNHPTFSDQSQYAQGEFKSLAGTWKGDKFIPAGQSPKVEAMLDKGELVVTINGQTARMPDTPKNRATLQKRYGITIF